MIALRLNFCGLSLFSFYGSLSFFRLFRRAFHVTLMRERYLLN